jgi:pilus assembly protein CpaB
MDPDPEGKAATSTVVTLLVKPQDAELVDLASNQGVIHFVLRNGVDREEFKGHPALFSDLSGDLAPATPHPSGGESSHKSLQLVVAAKPYQVETFMGTTVKTDNFQ